MTARTTPEQRYVERTTALCYSTRRAVIVTEHKRRHLKKPVDEHVQRVRSHSQPATRSIQPTTNERRSCSRAHDRTLTPCRRRQERYLPTTTTTTTTTATTTTTTTRERKKRKHHHRTASHTLTASQTRISSAATKKTSLHATKPTTINQSINQSINHSFIQQTTAKRTDEQRTTNTKRRTKERTNEGTNERTNFETF